LLQTGVALAKTSEFRRNCGEFDRPSFSADAGMSEDLVKIVQGGGESARAMIDAASG